MSKYQIVGNLMHWLILNIVDFDSQTGEDPANMDLQYLLVMLLRYPAQRLMTSHFYIFVVQIDNKKTTCSIAYRQFCEVK